MKFEETPLKGAWIIDLEPRGDDRGYFARTFCRKEFEAHGIEANVVQSNISFSAHAGTLRGMHFQKAPAEETKLVRCLTGALLDVIIDIRPDSPTYHQHIAVELTPENKRMLFVPRGFAHGFMTLKDNTEMLYMVSEFYTPEVESGLRHDDPAFGINWPLPVSVISAKDAIWPLIKDSQ
ncbi:dTDP-4-dehydrorhamnose 3,5-epimerase [Coraliomargarita sp. W4R53]